MMPNTYRRSRFSGAAYAEPSMVDAGYDEDTSWQVAVQAYDFTVRLDGHREAIQSLLHDAHWIVELEDNWDGEGGVGYDQDTLARAGQLLSDFAECCWDYWGCALTLPEVNPADDGSIDLAWRGDVHLLINVPGDDASPATFAALGPDLELYGSVSAKSLPPLVDLLRNGG